MHKVSLSIEEYINRLKDLMDAIIAAEDELSLRDQVMYALRGLGCKRMSLITNITLSKQVPQIEEVFTTMIAEESKLKEWISQPPTTPLFKIILQDLGITHLLLNSYFNLDLLFNKFLVHKLHFLIFHLSHKISGQEVMLHHKILGQKEVEVVVIKKNAKFAKSKVIVLLAVGSDLIQEISIMCLLKHIIIKFHQEIKHILTCFHM